MTCGSEDSYRSAGVPEPGEPQARENGYHAEAEIDLLLPARQQDDVGKVHRIVQRSDGRPKNHEDRVIADVEEEWGPITDEDIAAAPERLRRRVPPPA
ncbi:MAG: hypothetical protein JWR45_812 [Blastococcus sp.]|nr:hypothetical protein [Blastococcus sp.]